MVDRLEFVSEAEAALWMFDRIDDPCNDNYRFAFEDDDAAMIDYDHRMHDGCCGRFDAEVTINGRLAMIGCNYGH